MVQRLRYRDDGVLARVVRAARAGSAPPAAAVPREVLAGQYLAIARPANRRLDHDFGGLDDTGRSDLAAAGDDLRSAAATERRFDRQLMQLSMPPSVEAVARLLVAANRSRASLSSRAAASSTLAGLHGYLARLTAANAPVEEAVRVIRAQLGLPPPETS